MAGRARSCDCQIWEADTAGGGPHVHGQAGHEETAGELKVRYVVVASTRSGLSRGRIQEEFGYVMIWQEESQKRQKEERKTTTRTNPGTKKEQHKGHKTPPPPPPQSIDKKLAADQSESLVLTLTPL